MTMIESSVHTVESPIKPAQDAQTPFVFTWTLHAGYDGVITLIHQCAGLLVAHGHHVTVICADCLMVPELRKTGAQVLVLSPSELRHTLHTPEEFFALI